jgi:hypothetical protein
MSHPKDPERLRLLLWARLPESKKLVQDALLRARLANSLTAYSPITKSTEPILFSPTPPSAVLTTMRILLRKLSAHVEVDSSKNLSYVGSVPSWRSVTLRLRVSRVELESQNYGSDLDDRHYLILRFVSSRHSTLRRAYARVICFLSWFKTLGRSKED